MRIGEVSQGTARQALESIRTFLLFQKSASLVHLPSLAHLEEDEQLTICGLHAPASDQEWLLNFVSLASFMRSPCPHCLESESLVVADPSTGFVMLDIADLVAFVQACEAFISSQEASPPTGRDQAFALALSLADGFWAESFASDLPAPNLVKVLPKSLTQRARSLLLLLSRSNAAEPSYPAMLVQVRSGSLLSEMLEGFYPYSPGWALVPPDLHPTFLPLIAASAHLEAPIDDSVFETMKVLYFESSTGPLSSLEGALEAALNL